MVMFSMNLIKIRNYILEQIALLLLFPLFSKFVFGLQIVRKGEVIDDLLIDDLGSQNLRM